MCGRISGDLFPLSILSDCSVKGIAVGSLPSLWGQGLGGCVSTWVRSAGGLARMTLLVNVFAVPGLIPEPDASFKAREDMKRAGRAWTGPRRRHKPNLELWGLRENHALFFFPLQVCPGTCCTGTSASWLANSEEAKTHPVAHPSRHLFLQVKISFLLEIKFTLYSLAFQPCPVLLRESAQSKELTPHFSLYDTLKRLCSPGISPSAIVPPALDSFYSCTTSLLKLEAEHCPVHAPRTNTEINHLLWHQPSVSPPGSPLALSSAARCFWASAERGAQGFRSKFKKDTFSLSSLGI